MVMLDYPIVKNYDRQRKPEVFLAKAWYRYINIINRIYTSSSQIALVIAIRVTIQAAKRAGAICSGTAGIISGTNRSYFRRSSCPPPDQKQKLCHGKSPGSVSSRN